MQSTLDMVRDVTRLIRKQTGKRVVRTDLIYGLLRHWVYASRPDIFQYLKTECRDMGAQQ